MHLTIIDGHPDRDKQHFCHALAAAYAEGAKQSGHEVRLITIADMDVPFLRSQDEWVNGAVPPQLKEPQEALKWADHLVIVYPLWLGDVPAYLKAFSGTDCASEFRLRSSASLPEGGTTEGKIGAPHCHYGHAGARVSMVLSQA